MLTTYSLCATFPITCVVTKHLKQNVWFVFADMQVVIDITAVVMFACVF